jgi:hypothetical protein
VKGWTSFKAAFVAIKENPQKITAPKALQDIFPLFLMLGFYTILNEITQELEILLSFFFRERKEEVKRKDFNRLKNPDL